MSKKIGLPAGSDIFTVLSEREKVEREMIPPDNDTFTAEFSELVDELGLDFDTNPMTTKKLMRAMDTIAPRAEKSAPANPAAGHPDHDEHTAEVFQFPTIGPGEIHQKYGPTWILRNVVEIVERCMQVKPVYKKRGGARVPTGEYKADHATALRALQLLGKNHNLFTDKLEVKSTIMHLDDHQIEKRIRELTAAHPDLAALVHPPEPPDRTNADDSVIEGELTGDAGNASEPD